MDVLTWFEPLYFVAFVGELKETPPSAYGAPNPPQAEEKINHEESDTPGRDIVKQDAHIATLYAPATNQRQTS